MFYYICSPSYWKISRSNKTCKRNTSNFFDRHWEKKYCKMSFYHFFLRFFFSFIVETYSETSENTKAVIITIMSFRRVSIEDTTWMHLPQNTLLSLFKMTVWDSKQYFRLISWRGTLLTFNKKDLWSYILPLFAESRNTGSDFSWQVCRMSILS